MTPFRVALVLALALPAPAMAAGSDTGGAQVPLSGGAAGPEPVVVQPAPPPVSRARVPGVAAKPAVPAPIAPAKRARARAAVSKDLSVQVPDEPAPGSTPRATSPAGGTSGSGPLPLTGFGLAVVGAFGLLLLAAGWLARRRSGRGLPAPGDANVLPGRG